MMTTNPTKRRRGTLRNEVEVMITAIPPDMAAAVEAIKEKK